MFFLPMPKSLSTFFLISTKVSLLFLALSISLCASANEQLPVPNNPLFKLVLKDQDGHDLPLSLYQGNTFLLNFIYATCGSTCPLQTRQLVEVQKKIPQDKRQTIRFLSITVDPKHDTPAVLKAYAKTMGADLKSWAFATGTLEAISVITKQFQALDPRKPQPKPEDHTNNLYLHGKNGIILQSYSGDPVDVPRLAREIQEVDQMK